MKPVTLAAAAMLAAALLTACAGDGLPTENGHALAAGAATVNVPSHTSFSIPLEEIVISPCNGETIQLSGSASGQTTELSTEGEVLHSSMHYVVRETGIGLTTGATYVLRDVFYEGFDIPSNTAVNATFTFREANHFITSLPGLSFTGVAALHFVRTPNGDEQFTRDVFVDFDCKG